MQKQKVQAQSANRNEFPADDLRVETMLVKDLNEVMRIERGSFSSPWSRSYFAQEISRNPLAHPCILRERISGVVAGYIVCWMAQGQMHVNNLAVTPAFRNRGCGEILLRHALRLAEEHACSRAVLEVRPSNKSAIRLYGKLGFSIAGELPGYYSNGETALVLALEISGKE